MNIDQAAIFLANSILMVLGFLIILIGILVANNLIAKYWKSWGWTFMNWPNIESPKVLTQDELRKNKSVQEKSDAKT